MRKVIAYITIITIISCLFGVVAIVSAFDNENINVLIYGLDGRNDDEVERSDSIMLANYNFSTNELVITSIPRDSYVPITCLDNKMDKINHAYAYGKQECLNNTIKNLFEIENLKNIVFKFDDVVKIIDYFGLIEIIPEFSFCQSSVDGKMKYCFEKGKKMLIDGKQALAYMRCRKSLPNGDFDRIKNQRYIMKIILNKFLKMGVIDKVKFLNYAKENVESDLNIKDLNVRKIVDVQQIKVSEYTLKGENYYNKYYYYKLDQKYLEMIKKYYF